MAKTLTRPAEVARPATDQLRAAAYLRVSTEEQTKGYGIQYTSRRISTHAEKMGWLLVDTYPDGGVSGALEASHRDGLSRLMKDARSQPRPFDLVVVYEERAIGRADRAFWPWVWELEELGVFVAIVQGDYDNTTDEGRNRMRKAADRAMDERVLIRERTQAGIQEKADTGGHPGGAAPYGWLIESQGKKGLSRLIADEESDYRGFPALRQAWQLIVEERHNRRTAAVALNMLGYTGPNGRPWTADNLNYVLTSEPVQKGHPHLPQPHHRGDQARDATGSRRRAVARRDGRHGAGAGLQ
ncbi:recombinase family protein [Streptomyces sp. YS-3]|uniref:recombinase family protein n=1 Tax=Streptomyces sp. YS-3 TaxID=3381352 RepID=UPI003862CED4